MIIMRTKMKGRARDIQYIYTHRCRYAVYIYMYITDNL